MPMKKIALSEAIRGELQAPRGRGALKKAVKAVKAVKQRKSATSRVTRATTRTSRAAGSSGGEGYDWRRLEVHEIRRPAVTDTVVHKYLGAPQSVGTLPPGGGGATVRSAIVHGAAGLGAARVLKGAGKLLLRTAVKATPVGRVASTVYTGHKLLKAARAGQKLKAAEVVKALIL